MGIGDLLGGASGNGSNKLVIWVLVIIIVFGFGKGKKFSNFNFQNQSGIGNSPPNKKYASQRHKRKQHITSNSFNNNSNLLDSLGVSFGSGFGGKNSGGIGKMLGGNALFVVIIVAVIFLCKDKTERLESSTSTTTP